MPLDLYQLSKQCSPQVAPITMVTLIKTESEGKPWAIALNGARLRFQPSSESQATAWVRYLDQHGYNFDVGLGQVNISTIRRFKLKPEQLLNPCLNVKISGQVLTENYLQAHKKIKDPQQALQVALSMYNSGNQSRGFFNGYVAKILANIPH